MSKRTHSEIVTPTDALTAAVESPKKRGRPCKKLEPLPKEVMKAIEILNAYVKKQQAQAQEASDFAAISSPEVSEGSPPVKRKGGWPKGKPRKPKSPSPEVSEEPKSKEAEAGVAQEQQEALQTEEVQAEEVQTEEVQTEEVQAEEVQAEEVQTEEVQTEEVQN